jgi:hypothetical protein
MVLPKDHGSPFVVLPDAAHLGHRVLTPFHPPFAMRPSHEKSRKTNHVSSRRLADRHFL